MVAPPSPTRAAIGKFIPFRVENEPRLCMSGRARSPASLPAVLLILLPLIITPALCTDIEIRPEAITPGSPISIGLYNVTDGAGLNITVTSSFLPPAPTSWCNFTNWRYSFALQNGNVTVRGENTNRIQLLVRTGGTFRMTEKTGTGDITVSFPLEYLPEMYYDFRILYEAHDAKAPVRLSVMHQGNKNGAEESVSTPNVFGISEGNLTVRVLEAGKFLGSGEIRVSQTVPVTTTSPETPAPTATSGPEETPSPATTATTAPGTTVRTPPATRAPAPDPAGPPPGPPRPPPPPPPPPRRG